VQVLVRGWPIPFYNSLRIGGFCGGRLRALWKEDRPDVVHIATEGPLGYCALRIARKLRIPVSSSFHTNFHKYGGHYGFHFGKGMALRYLRWFHNRAGVTMVPTEEIRAQLATQGFERLQVLSRGVDARLFSPTKRSEALRRKWGAGPDDTVVIYVGRIAAEKGIDLAVETYREMHVIDPRTKFVLVGDGPMLQDLQSKYPNFIYAGLKRGEDLAAHYASADVFLFASETETFGNVVTEALASGLLVAGYDYAALRQHVSDGLNGMSVSLGDRQGFVQMGRDILSVRADWPSLRSAARLTAQSISWEVIMSQFESRLGSLRAST
jgi:glycosyltransferase involved in cell wall biosynthesis